MNTLSQPGARALIGEAQNPIQSISLKTPRQGRQSLTKSISGLGVGGTRTLLGSGDKETNSQTTHPNYGEISLLPKDAGALKRATKAPGGQTQANKMEKS